jgi:hypothetical protein
MNTEPHIRTVFMSSGFAGEWLRPGTTLSAISG